MFPGSLLHFKPQFDKVPIPDGIFVTSINPHADENQIKGNNIIKHINLDRKYGFNVQF